MQFLKNKKICGILIGILFLLLICVSILLFWPSSDIPAEKGAADLILDSEIDSLQNPPVASETKENSLTETQTDTQNFDNPSRTDGTPSGEISTGTDNSYAGSGESQPPSSSENGTPAPDDSASSGNDRPQESTNRHPYELPLIPVQTS